MANDSPNTTTTDIPPPPPPPQDSRNQDRADALGNHRGRAGSFESLGLEPTADFQHHLDDFKERKAIRQGPAEGLVRDGLPDQHEGLVRDGSPGQKLESASEATGAQPENALRSKADVATVYDAGSTYSGTRAEEGDIRVYNGELLRTGQDPSGGSEDVYDATAKNGPIGGNSETDYSAAANSSSPESRSDAVSISGENGSDVRNDTNNVKKTANEAYGAALKVSADEPGELAGQLDSAYETQHNEGDIVRHGHHGNEYDEGLFSRTTGRSNQDILDAGDGLPRTFDTIRKHADASGVDIGDTPIEIVEDPETVRYLDYQNAMARTDPDGIQLGPAAFADSETLVRALAHEMQHGRQYQDGRSVTSETIQSLEDEAYAIEDGYVQRWRES